MSRLALSNVTLCAAASVNVGATIEAMIASVAQVSFADALLFTDADITDAHPEIRVVSIQKLASVSDYSTFLLKDLAGYVETSHCLIVQWDGFVLDARRWSPDFLAYDYVGAPWPQFDDGYDVGNGGFSLRSRRLLVASSDPRFLEGGAEDLAICRINRGFLESEHEIRFADWNTASRFSFERSSPRGPTFGFHGIFNMALVLGHERLWEIYCGLDDRRSAFTDYGNLMRQLGTGPNQLARRCRLSVDFLRSIFG